MGLPFLRRRPLARRGARQRPPLTSCAGDALAHERAGQRGDDSRRRPAHVHAERGDGAPRQADRPPRSDGAAHACRGARLARANLCSQLLPQRARGQAESRESDAERRGCARRRQRSCRRGRVAALRADLLCAGHVRVGAAALLPLGAARQRGLPPGRPQHRPQPRGGHPRQPTRRAHRERRRRPLLLQLHRRLGRAALLPRK
mmetsp:Transcript_26832/g.80110  ORF Transcript_26832/g.80110 Transcript_26832/m.80110 type:complete len:203 (-) Transcript_26832:833-1441(-)